MTTPHRPFRARTAGTGRDEHARPRRRVPRRAFATLALVAVLSPTAARAGTSEPARAAPPEPGYVLPVPGAAVARPFEPPPERWAAGHRGVDLTAGVGAVVVAPQAGVVTFAGRVAGRPVVSVRHDDGLVTSLEPVTGTPAAGVRVVRGAPVGTVDPAPGHCAPAACVHWGVRTGPRTYTDPLALVNGAGPVVLLP